MKCAYCESSGAQVILDLGSQPPANSLLEQETEEPERFFPLRLIFCSNCLLCFTEQVVSSDELFTKSYPYMSGYSDAWLNHCHSFVHELELEFNLSASSVVCEVATNDGVLLDMFARQGVSCYGVEPTQLAADIAIAKGLKVFTLFLGEKTAAEIVGSGTSRCDVLVANNVLAHVPDIRDFLVGCKTLMQDDGIATFEFQHLGSLIENDQFDTIYHEHFSYLSLGFLARAVQDVGLEVFNVEKFPTHGGSLRVYVQKLHQGKCEVSHRVESLLTEERDLGLFDIANLQRFAMRVQDTAKEFRNFLLACNREGSVVVGYGAAAKANTILNYCGIKSDLLPFVVDRNPYKQGKLLPGSHIPVVGVDRLEELNPDYVVILAWNLRDEVHDQLGHLRGNGTQFVTSIPKLVIT